jgi:hypothetical protein
VVEDERLIMTFLAILLGLIVGGLFGCLLGWVWAHNTVLNEAKKLGRFYVGPDVVECTVHEGAR